MQQYVPDGHGYRYYEKTAGPDTHYLTRFKKDRLYYYLIFDDQGNPEEAAIVISEIDIPRTAWEALRAHLESYYPRYRIRELRQSYTLQRETLVADFKKVFQNLLVPEMTYGILLRTRAEDGRQTLEILFDSEGNKIGVQEVFPPRHDHVLY